MDLTRLQHINSMTKYPEIPTFHAMGAKGVLQENEYIKFEGTVIGTEKVNGTNTRIIVFPDGDWIIGSREELLCAKGDRVPNQALGIVETVQGVAHRLTWDYQHRTTTVYYGETYGGGIEGGKAYAKGMTDFRLFDAAMFPMYEEVLFWERDRIASWRQHGGQPYLDEYEFLDLAHSRNLAVVPRLFAMSADDLPTTILGGKDLLEEFAPVTKVALDREPGRAEGIVIRTTGATRQLAKIRFEDYERTLRKTGLAK